jgi:predicted DNA-binding protein (MmcQ/YjbR family)
MNIEDFRELCIRKPGVTEELPFGPDALVFKVMGKMFALCSIDNFQSFNAKCDPEKAIELRAEYTGIRPGYHMSKIHWNTIDCDGSVGEDLMIELLNQSYDLVKNSLPKKIQAELDVMEQ